MRRARAAVAMLAVAAAGCGSPDTSSTPGPFVPLSESYSSMTGEEFSALVESVLWVNGNTRQRCTNNPCTDSVPVSIHANASSFTIDSLNPGPLGVLVARARNMGSDTTHMYRFKPGAYRYYFLVRRNGGMTRWTLLEHNPGSAPDSVDSGPFTGCWDHPPATEASADFRNCGPKVSSALTGLRVASFAPALPRLRARRSVQGTAAEAGGWIGCAYGCCPVAY